MKLQKKILFYSLSLVLFYAVFELFLFAVLIFKYKKILTPVQYLELTTNFNWEKTNSGNCPQSTTSYLNHLGPHPYLGYTLWNPENPECDKSGFSNNENFSGPDFPRFKDEKYFTILLTGGSVADQLGTSKNKEGGFFTEDYLNKNFELPDGRKFKVLVAALGDYRMPQSLIAVMLYHDIIDGVIDLSGYNESHNYFNNRKLEEPSPNYWGLFDLEIENELSQKRNDIFMLARSGERSFLCTHSYTCMTLLQFSITHKLQELLEYQSPHKARYVSQKSTQALYAKDIPYESVVAHRKQKHRSYIKLFNGMCTTLNIKCSFFIQPIPQIGKSRVAEEEISIKNEHSTLAEVYADLSANLMTLKTENVDISNLSQIFSFEKGRIYSDHIHYYRAPEETVSKGNQLVWKTITEKIAVSWKLNKKSSH